MNLAIERAKIYKEGKDIKIDNNILEMLNISKKFTGVQALDNVSLILKKGEIMGLVGENGAGKSTLIKILSGVYTKDQGQILIDGKEVVIKNVIDSMNLGISVIYQEFSLIPNLTVAENIYLGIEKTLSGKKFFFSNRQIIEESQKILDSIDIKIDPTSKLEDLGRADQQLVEIAKGFRMGKNIYVLDEPTASLASHEVENLFNVIKNVLKKGNSIIFITHRLDEIIKICDEVTIIKDGKNIGIFPVSEMNVHRISELMVSERIANKIEESVKNKKRKIIKEEPFIKLRNFSRKGLFENLNLDLNKGEILGIGGLLGVGRTELFRSVIGLDKKESGDVFIGDKKVAIKSPIDALNNGIVYSTEDRRNEGLFYDQSIISNISISSLSKILKFLNFIKLNDEYSQAEKLSKDLNIKITSINQLAMTMSGGNQQKVVIARWLFSKADMIIFDEPTVGVDVGAKEEIHLLIEGLAKLGKVIVAICTEIPELLRLSDKIIVMDRKGNLSEKMSVFDVDDKDLISLMIK